MLHGSHQYTPVMLPYTAAPWVEISTGIFSWNMGYKSNIHIIYPMFHQYNWFISHEYPIFYRIIYGTNIIWLPMKYGNWIWWYSKHSVKLHIFDVGLSQWHLAAPGAAPPLEGCGRPFWGRHIASIFKLLYPLVMTNIAIENGDL